MACNKQFENLFTILDNSEYDLDTPFKKVIKEAVEKAGFCDQEGEAPREQKIQVNKGEGGKKNRKETGKKTEKMRKTSSYNLFVGHQMKNQGKTMGEAVTLWKELGEKEKLVWKEEASVLDLKKEMELREENKKSQEKSQKKGKSVKKLETKSDKKSKGKKSKKNRKTSGYNLFIGDLMKNQGKKLGEAVALWKELSDEDKMVWKEKAVVFNEEKENPQKKGKEESKSDSEETISM